MKIEEVKTAAVAETWK